MIRQEENVKVLQPSPGTKAFLIFWIILVTLYVGQSLINALPNLTKMPLSNNLITLGLLLFYGLVIFHFLQGMTRTVSYFPAGKLLTFKTLFSRKEFVLDETCSYNIGSEIGSRGGTTHRTELFRRQSKIFSESLNGLNLKEATSFFNQVFGSQRNN